MNNKFYYIIISLIIIFNLSLLIQNSNLNEKYDEIIFKEESSSVTSNQIYTYNPYNLSNSKYIDKLEGINISSGTMLLKFKDSSHAFEIAEDTQNLLNKKLTGVNIIDDSYIIIEFKN